MRALFFSLLLLTVPAGPAAAVDHDAWDALLKEHVREGLVDYAGMAGDRARLETYLGDLATAEPESLSENEQIAFWANAYNARMIALVLDNSPIRGDDSSHPANSVLQVPGIFKKHPARIGGREVTLDRIEHQILRPRFREPRIHAAIVCASGSCPELRAEAFTGQRLQAQLDDQFRRFVNDERRNLIELEAGRVRLSKIFDWFAEDFAGAAEGRPALRRSAGKHAGVLAFVAPYLPEAEGRALLAGDLGVSFLPYDWALNDASAPPTFPR